MHFLKRLDISKHMFFLSCQTLPAAVYEAHPDPTRPTGGWRQKDLVSESGQRWACLLLQRVRRESVTSSTSRITLINHCKTTCLIAVCRTKYLFTHILLFINLSNKNGSFTHGYRTVRLTTQFTNQEQNLLSTVWLLKNKSSCWWSLLEFLQYPGYKCESKIRSKLW